MLKRFFLMISVILGLEVVCQRNPGHTYRQREGRAVIGRQSAERQLVWRLRPASERQDRLLRQRAGCRERSLGRDLQTGDDQGHSECASGQRRRGERLCASSQPPGSLLRPGLRLEACRTASRRRREQNQRGPQSTLRSALERPSRAPRVRGQAAPRWSERCEPRPGRDRFRKRGYAQSLAPGSGFAITIK